MDSGQVLFCGRCRLKHAHASHVSVLLIRKHSSVAAVIEDDGDGFDPSAADQGRLGLVGMRERLALLEGRLEIESSEGAGTTIVAEVPLREADLREAPAR